MQSHVYSVNFTTKCRFNIHKWCAPPHEVVFLFLVWHMAHVFLFLCDVCPVNGTLLRAYVVRCHYDKTNDTMRTDKCRNLNVIQSLHFLTLRKRVFRSMHFIFCSVSVLCMFYVLQTPKTSKSSPLLYYSSFASFSSTFFTTKVFFQKSHCSVLFSSLFSLRESIRTSTGDGRLRCGGTYTTMVPITYCKRARAPTHTI